MAIVTSVEILYGRTVRLGFADGSMRVVDLAPFLWGPALGRQAVNPHVLGGKHQALTVGCDRGRGQDHAHGPPMLDGALENLQSLGHGEEYFAGKIFTADTNYHSDTNLRKCQELRLDAYIPDIYFRRRDPRYAAQQRYWPRRKRFRVRSRAS